MEAKKDLTLQPVAAELFARLEAGERLDSASLATIRYDLARLLETIHLELFASLTTEHRAWVARQQDYTGRIVVALEEAYFATLREVAQHDVVPS